MLLSHVLALNENNNDNQINFYFRLFGSSGQVTDFFH